jgi:hypothetical protein
MCGISKPSNTVQMAFRILRRLIMRPAAVRAQLPATACAYHIWVAPQFSRRNRETQYPRRGFVVNTVRGRRINLAGRRVGASANGSRGPEFELLGGTLLTI